jgi:hypothetical protein
MSPELRAAADSFIYDVAMLLHVSDSLGDRDFERTVAATGWTLRQTFGHVAASYERYAGALERRVRGEHAPWEPVPSVVTAAAEKETPADVLAERMLGARRRILASLEVVTPGQEASPLADGFPPLRQVVAAWARHGSGHSVDILEAAPDLGGDPLIIGWAFYPQPGEDGSLRGRRDALLERLRKLQKESRT